MKNIFVIVLLLVFVASCSDEIEHNSPSIQGEVNGEFFRATTPTATINSDSTVSITGTTTAETITLKTADFALGNYSLGQGTESEAIFETVDGEIYLTGTTGEGQVSITRIGNGTLSGEFYFNARRNGTEDTLNFNKGSFFDVPLDNFEGDNEEEEGDEDMTCEEASQNAATAMQAYISAQNNEDEDAIEATCLDYKGALEQQIEICGDDSGELQGVIDELDCTNDGGIDD